MATVWTATMELIAVPSAMLIVPVPAPVPDWKMSEPWLSLMPPVKVAMLSNSSAPGPVLMIAPPKMPLVPPLWITLSCNPCVEKPPTATVRSEPLRSSGRALLI